MEVANAYYHTASDLDVAGMVPYPKKKVSDSYCG